MSTRGFVTFVIDGAEKTTYNHSDSYPDGLGIDVLGWLRTADPNTVAEQARALRVVAENERPAEADVERLRKYADVGVGTQTVDDWYCLLRETQGDPAAMLDAGAVLDASTFPQDSLFAEWGYVIDLDAMKFEVYRGFQQSPHKSGRFASRPGITDGYAPVALNASWPLNELPDSDAFIAATGVGEE